LSKHAESHFGGVVISIFRPNFLINNIVHIIINYLDKLVNKFGSNVNTVSFIEEREIVTGRRFHDRNSR